MKDVFDQKKDLHFWDLGSGLGKPCLSAAFTLPDNIAKCSGIELLDCLYETSLKVIEEYE